jgi:hypothetical protein
MWEFAPPELDSREHMVHTWGLRRQVQKFLAWFAECMVQSSALADFDLLAALGPSLIQQRGALFWTER